MTKDVASQIFTILSGMPGGADQAWRDEMRKAYTPVLTALGDDLGKRVVNRATVVCKWRPTPHELVDIALDLESPSPTWETAITELLYRAAHGEPLERMSHSLIVDAVLAMGGWEAVQWEIHGCAMGDKNRMTMRSQFREIYEGLRRQFREEAMEFLGNTPETRPTYYFPAYRPFQHPEGSRARLSALLEPQKALEIEGCPPAREGGRRGARANMPRLEKTDIRALAILGCEESGLPIPDCLRSPEWQREKAVLDEAERKRVIEEAEVRARAAAERAAAKAVTQGKESAG